MLRGRQPLRPRRTPPAASRRATRRDEARRQPVAGRHRRPVVGEGRVADHDGCAGVVADGDVERRAWRRVRAARARTDVRSVAATPRVYGWVVAAFVVAGGVAATRRAWSSGARMGTMDVGGLAGVDQPVLLAGDAARPRVGLELAGLAS